MTTFYLSKHLAITDRTVVIRREPVVRIPVAELRSVRGEQRTTAVRGRPALVQLAGAALALGVISVPVLDSPVALVSTLLTVVAAATVGRTRHRTRTTVWELRAVYRQVEICLYRTANEREFNQIKRAMLRALEANERW